VNSVDISGKNATPPEPRKYLSGRAWLSCDSFILIAEKTDGIDDDIGLLNFAHGFFKRVTADIVFAIGDHQQNLFVLWPFFR